MSGEPLRARTRAYALAGIRFYSVLPRDVVAQTVGRQFLRSCTSVGANYREGSRSRTTAEMISKFGIVLQELEESAYWLELLDDKHMGQESARKTLQKETDELLAIVVTMSKKLKSRKP